MRAVYGWLRVVASGLRYLRKNKSVDNRHGSFTVSASCDELFTDTSELLRMLAIDYELGIRKDS